MNKSTKARLEETSGTAKGSQEKVKTQKKALALSSKKFFTDIKSELKNIRLDVNKLAEGEKNDSPKQDSVGAREGESSKKLNYIRIKKEEGENG